MMPGLDTEKLRLVFDVTSVGKPCVRMGKFQYILSGNWHRHSAQQDVVSGVTRDFGEDLSTDVRLPLPW